jgi:hypothetical protein
MSNFVLAYSDKGQPYLVNLNFVSDFKPDETDESITWMSVRLSGDRVFPLRVGASLTSIVDQLGVAVVGRTLPAREIVVKGPAAS